MNSYDLLKMPVDINRANIGLAFINFKNFREILGFCREFHKTSNLHESFSSTEKVYLEFYHIQGIEEIQAHYSEKYLTKHDR